MFEKKITWLISVIVVFEEIRAADDDYNVLRTDGSYDFGYDNPDSYHYAQANRHNVVRGEFGGRNPKTGGIDTTYYTAGPRGFRPRGKNVVRKYDLSQNGPRAIGSPDDPYYDPYEDPSYSFSFRTRTYNRDENANRVGDVNGRYSYIDDIGERHNVEFIAGKKTGFHVKTPFPDSNPRGYGPLYFRGRGKPIPRGRTSIQRGLDGSYKFVSAGPDQRRTETSDATGHVRGSYTYLDDKGVQHSVHYIAGPETGYRVLKNVKGPHLPSVFPFQHPDIIPPDFYDNPEIFNTAASDHGRVKPSSKPGFKDEDNGIDEDNDDFGKTKPSGGRPPYRKDPFGNRKPPILPISPFDEGDTDDNTDFDDLFGGGGKGSASSGGNRGGGGTLDDGGSREAGGAAGSGGSRGGAKPTGSGGSRGGGSGGKPATSGEDSFGISKEDDGSYKPPKNGQNGLYIPPKPSKKPPGGFSDEDFNFPNKQSPSEEKDDFDTFSGGRSKPGSKSKPTNDGSASNEDVDFGGLFGSESNRPRPPYGGGTGPVLTIGGPNKNCPKCEGAIVTNIGDTYLAVPPRSSVRAHVQAIDLLPYSSRFPGPSDQYKADVSLKTEQLNAEKDEIVSKIDDKNKARGGEAKTLEREQLMTRKNSVVNRNDDKKDVVNEDDDESQTTEETSTEIVPTTFSPKNTTIK